jgi:Arc/MetJ-type ribon-helix-helix transcriptional regulator
MDTSKNEIVSGFYNNSKGVIRDAIRQIQTEDNRITLFRTAVAKGDMQIDRGKGVAHTPELMASLTQTAINETHSG